MRVRLEKDGATLALDGQPIARGGEAAILALPDQPGLLAKVYHQASPEHADKLAAMIAAPPADPTAKIGHASIAWPTQRLFEADGDGCVGFLMPRVDKARPLFDAYNPKSRLQAWPMFHYGYLLRTARNLSAAVRALHARGYVLGDLNESNVLVNSQTLVTVVDTDSFQVRAGERVFRCTVGKPEFAAPEIQGADFAAVDRKPEQDAFALAVLIFQLLMQGTHPFAGKFTGEGEPETLARRITAGHWPYARNRRGPFEPNPTAPPFVVLPPQVRELMRQCFEDGHDRPSIRPDAAEWHKALTEADEQLTECVVNGQHRFHKSLDACPWCELTVKQGRDPFPAKGKALTGADKSGKQAPASAAVTQKPNAATPASRPAAVAARPIPRGPAVPQRPAHGKPAAPSFLATPWPWVIGGGAAFLLLCSGLAAALSAIFLWPSQPTPIVFGPPPHHPAAIDDPPPVWPGPAPGAMMPGVGDLGGPIGPGAAPWQPPGPAPGIGMAPPGVDPGPAVPRLAPDVLQPDESRVAVVRFQAAAYVFSKDLQSVLTLKGGPLAPGAPGGPIGPMGPIGPIGPMGLNPGSATLPNPNGLNLLKGMSRRPPPIDRHNPISDRMENDFDMEWVRVDQIAQVDPGSLAEQVYPVRAAEIVAAFPFKKQVAEFRTRLGLRSDVDVLAEIAADPGDGSAPSAFRFLGVAVERRELDASGRPVGPDDGWKPLDLDGEYKARLALCGDRTDPDDPDLESVLLPPLAMPKLATFAARRTPLAEPSPGIERNLNHVAATLDGLRNNPGVPLRQPGAFPGPAGVFAPGPAVPGPLQPPEFGAPPGAQAVPEYCVIRLFDVTIDPGKVYEYRFRTRMANPNFGRKDAAAGVDTANKELTAKDWYVVPEKVVSPSDLCIYAVDQKDLDIADPLRPPGTPRPVNQPVRSWETVLQIHRWFDTLPTKTHGELPVGDWVIAERVIVARGEPVHRPRVEVPYWRTAQARFVLASDAPPKPNGPRPKGLPQIDAPFTPDGEEPILVDFTGGNVTYARTHPATDDAPAAPPPLSVSDREPGEVLLCGADGKLLLRSTATDAVDPERDVRVKAYRHWVQQVDAMKAGMERPADPFGK